MSLGMKLICYDCRCSAYVGTLNSGVVEDAEKVGKFLWKHSGCNIGTLKESQGTYYEGWPEDEKLDEEVDDG
jgi:hypothetical protein